MLRDLRHEFMSPESFAAWLETKDPDEEYFYCDNGNCACAQYLKEKGYEHCCVTANHYSLERFRFFKRTDWQDIPRAIADAVATKANIKNQLCPRYTFGTALAALRKEMAKEYA